MPSDGSFRIATYNIHKCRGLDGRVQPERVVDVLREIDADVIALQEVVSIGHRDPRDDQAAFIADELGLHFCFGENRKFRGGRYGNVILTRLPVIFERNYDLSRPGREERGCLRTDVLLDGRVLHIYNVHLGTAYLERRHQGRRLVGPDILAGVDFHGPRIMVGDFNEWLRGLTTRLLTEHFGSADIRLHLGRRRTYPGPLPLLHLDHVYFDDGLQLEGAMLHRSRKALIASDHLPIGADFRLKSQAIRTFERGPTGGKLFFRGRS
jgi:endonuclease/exonuclease/phosphatase family metal-dependent hydrolase